MTALELPVRVLLVEDSADDAELIVRRLLDAGVAAATRLVTDEAGLRAELAAFSPELILADWSLPGFSGRAAVAIAHAWDPAVPCILVSGTLGEDLVVEALRTGATDYVLKQRLEALGPAVRRALAEAAEHRETTRLEAELATSQAAMRGALDAMADPFAICSAIRDASGAIVDFAIVFANRAAAAFAGLTPNDIAGHSFQTALPEGLRTNLFAASVDVVETGHPFTADGLGTGHRIGAGSANESLIDITIAPFEDGFFVVFRDVTERVLVARERNRLAAVVEESTDAITLADADGLVTYANPAFQRLVDLPEAQITGQPMSVIASAVLDAAQVAKVDALVRSGRPWRGEVDVVPAVGVVRRVELTVNPRIGPDQVVSAIVTVMHDVTDLREAQADLALQADLRSHLSDVLRGVRGDTTLEQAAQMICDQLVTLPNIHQAAVDVFLAPDELRVIGLAAPTGFPLAVGDVLPASRAALIHKRLQSGSWAWYAGEDSTGDDWAGRTVEAGLRASAYGPIALGEELVGALVIGTYSDAFARTLVEKMPAIVSFSSTSSGLVALRMQAMRREANSRRSLDAMIAARAFHPVFQPIVDLESREVLGYEALTRFDSGQRPDLCFAEAHAVDLGPRLEVATLEAALASAASLPSGLWLSVNVSPTLLAETGTLRAILRSAGRPVVVEVTEHDEIVDYAAVRDAIYAAGKSTRLAVDDAGVGVANFNHIIELRPDFVKLDISLVRGISADLGRQALVVGLLHFARTAGCRLIAEGIETEEEATTLRRLGVEFGQGYLFGRPEPVETWGRSRRSEAEIHERPGGSRPTNGQRTALRSHIAHAAGPPA